MMKSILVGFLGLWLLLSSFGNNLDEKIVAYSYIDRFAPLAIDEMHRVGIPASIKLAQAMLESNLGRSTLATNSNNHFGIKCKSYWTGLQYYHKDDDFDSKGKLIESCFRAYDDIESSFKDHSDFLKNSGKYDVLFGLDAIDYKAWAHGLKSCGYATDKTYALKLIRTIEDFQLYRYDTFSALGYDIPELNSQIVSKITYKESTVD
jgi:flagellum-specific peptidoglycan hydrolase FlgJ